MSEEVKCSYCDKVIPEDEWINLAINPITKEHKKYCEKCREWITSTETMEREKEWYKQH